MNNKQKLYEHLVRSYSTELYRYAVRLSGDADVAEDLVQETFYEAWKSIPSLKDESKGRAWIYQILRHRFSHWLRGLKRHVQQDVTLHEIDNQFSQYDDPIHQIIDQQMLQEGLNKLNESSREPFLMVYLAGFTCQETADLLELPLGTVLSRIHRARATLKKFMKENQSQDSQIINFNECKKTIQENK